MGRGRQVEDVRRDYAGNRRPELVRTLYRGGDAERPVSCVETGRCVLTGQCAPTYGSTSSKTSFALPGGFIPGWDSSRI